MTKPAKPPIAPPPSERPSPNARERVICREFMTARPITESFVDALAQLLADYRGELKAERIALDKCTRGNR